MAHAHGKVEDPGNKALWETAELGCRSFGLEMHWETGNLYHQHRSFCGEPVSAEAVVLSSVYRDTSALSIRSGSWKHVIVTDTRHAFTLPLSP